MTQVFNVFVLPVVVGGMIALINNSKLMKGHKPGVFLNVLLSLALLFSVIISYNGVAALFETFTR